MFYSLFNYTKLFLWSIIFYCNYKFYEECNLDLLNIVLYNIQMTNSMAVKCIQKLIPYLKMCDYNKNIINILNKVYEENIYHNDKETLKIYYNDFNEPIHKKYEIIDRISSGSIGQIYKIKNIYTNTLYAMKVVHPNIKYHISFIQSMIKLFNLQTFIFFELDVFMNNFINETDFIKESENMKLFIDYYKDNDRIIIPEVYEYSRNIIIMDFIEGEIITNLSIYEKSKYIILSLLFCNNNKYYFGLNHGDLHMGNFKKYEHNKIVIYDFGFCFKLKDKNIVDVLDNFYYHLTEPTYKFKYTYNECIEYLIRYHVNKYDISEYSNDINEIFINNKVKSLEDLVKKSYIMFKKNNILVKVEYLNLLINYYFSCEFNDCNNNDLLSFCQTYEIFNDYQKRLKINNYHIKEPSLEKYDKNLYDNLKELM